MAVDIQHPLSQSIASAPESDYGSDLDDDTWEAAFSQPAPQPVPQIKIEDIEEPVLPDDEEPQTRALRLTRVREHLVAAIQGLDEERRRQERDPSVEVEYNARQRQSFTPIESEMLERQKSPATETVERQASPAVESPPQARDERSPLQRFRTAPKKTLSVTDLVSPAWCELKYWYSLTKYGRVRRTAAMKQGSKIHKEKEREVHTEVPIEVVTKEDRLGLRLWNIIQGLRTLRNTGLTRELEVMGVIDGQVIIGIIDELSHQCPDEALEEKIIAEAQAARTGGKKTEALPADQRTINDFFASPQDAGVLCSQDSWLGTLQAMRKPIYLVDIKTRQSNSVPTLGSQMRPTQMQLMLYRRLLNGLAANEVDADAIFQRYDLDPHQSFSDTFIAGMAGIDFSLSQPSRHEDEPMAMEPDPLDEILGHKTLRSLWAHMIAEFAKTISVTAISSSISLLLTAEFRDAANGHVIGTRSFAYEQDTLDRYVQDEMSWWKGQREAKGVEIEEAYKCGSCEFAEGCTWRASKVEEATIKARMRNARRTSTTKSQI